MLKSPELNDTFSKFEKSGNEVVERPKYHQENKRVYINGTQYFSNIDREIWEYHVGGYKVMAKWLKDRKKRRLSIDEIQHYIKVARALQLTIQYQEKIDDLYEDVEKSL